MGAGSKPSVPRLGCFRGSFSDLQLTCVYNDSRSIVQEPFVGTNAASERIQGHN